MDSAFELSARQRDILFQLAALDKPSGSDVHSMLVETTAWTIRKSQLYSNMSTLEDEGFVQSAAVDGRQKEYWLTDEGSEALEEYYGWVEDRYASAGLPE